MTSFLNDDVWCARSAKYFIGKIITDYYTEKKWQQPNCKYSMKCVLMEMRGGKNVRGLDGFKKGGLGEIKDFGGE